MAILSLLSLILLNIRSPFFQSFIYILFNHMDEVYKNRFRLLTQLYYHLFIQLSTLNFRFKAKNYKNF